MLYAGVQKHKLVAFAGEGEVLVLQRLAVETDQVARLAEAGCKLIHYSALDAAVVVLRGLAYLGKLEQVEAVAENIVQGEGEGAFESRGGGKARSQRNVSAEYGAEAFDLAAPLEHLPAHAEYVFGPLLRGRILFVQAEFCILVEVYGEHFYLVCSVGGDSGHYALVNGAWKHVSAVVVCMFTYQVYTAGGRIHVAVLAEQHLEFLLNLLFHQSARYFLIGQR